MFLFAAYSNKADPIWTGLVPWSRDTVQWQPLCSHFSLCERSPGDFGLSPELLERLAAERKARVHARRLESKRRSIARNKEATAEQHKRTIAKARASGKYRCEICDYSFGKPWLLTKHLAGQRHKDKEAKVAAGELEPTGNALRSRKCVAKAKEEKRHYCAVCDKAFGLAARLQKHLATKSHCAAAAAADEELAAVESDCPSV
jgi:hypothetical protein